QTERETFVTSGTSGGVGPARWGTSKSRDGGIRFDPRFVMYPPFITITRRPPGLVGPPPPFPPRPARVGAAPPPRHQARTVNSPANPTGVVHERRTLEQLARLAADRRVLLISDEVYRVFCYDQPFCSPAEFNDDVLVLDGFSKAYAMTGWRLGYCHGPRRLIE